MNLRLVDSFGERVGPTPNDYSTIGDYLRALREHKGLTLAELATMTRIRKAYLQGIEEGDRSSMPARPFAIGYVRSYALALGIDGDAAAARFKKETPDVSDPFMGPVGVAHDKPKRSPLIFATIFLILTGVVLWNVVQRTMIQEDREVGSMPSAPAEAATSAPAPVVAIGASTPAPAAQNLPEPYMTPGLNGPITPDGQAPKPGVQTVAVAAQAQADPATFTAKGAVYGAPASPVAGVVLQARKPASLIVRGAGGAVYFARQLAAGEAFRAPSGEGLTAEVSDPAAFALYVAGDSKGALVSQQTALDKLVVRPTTAAIPRPAPPRPVAGPAQFQAAHHVSVREPAPTAGEVAYYTQPRT